MGKKGTCQPASPCCRFLHRATFPRVLPRSKDQQESAHPSQEAQLLGSYRIIRLLGEGGMGQVFEAFSEALQRRVAIKLMKPELLGNPDLVQRFLSEARAANLVGDPGIVSVFDLAQDQRGAHYLVMEFLEGETLTARRARGPLPVAMVVHLAWQLAHSLATAHARGVVHRDLKPDNVMIVRDPAAVGGERTKILDFGIAKLTETPQTQWGACMGTPRYMAPEQRANTSDVDGRADVFALGVLCSELLFDEAAAPHLNPQIPPALVALLARTQAAQRDLRPAMATVAAELLQIGHAPQAAARRPLWLSALSLLLCLVVLALAASRIRRQRSAAKPSPIPAAPALVSAAQPTVALDPTEVTNRAFAAWLNHVRASLSLDAQRRLVSQDGRLLVDLYPPASGLRIEAGDFAVREGQEDLPVVQVTWDGAARFCQARGERLPTEVEWAQAAVALSPETLAAEPGACDGAVFGRRAGGACSRYPTGPARVGQARRDRTPAGLLDVGGNVAEWTGTRLTEPDRAVIRGGDWARPAALLLRGRSESAVEVPRPNVGFRCARALASQHGGPG